VGDEGRLNLRVYCGVEGQSCFLRNVTNHLAIKDDLTLCDIDDNEKARVFDVLAD
jgi:hypothetical protein